VLSDCSALLPSASYERDPTVDYHIHQATLYTMATCHSLRSVDEELLGDPLDVKMFEFTSWSFKELAQKTNVMEENVQNSPSSIARPPAGLEYGMDVFNKSISVSTVTIRTVPRAAYWFVEQIH